MATQTRTPLIVCLMAVVSLAAHGQMRQGKLGVGIAASAYQYSGDYTFVTPRAGGGLSVTYNPFPYIGIRSLVGFGQFGYRVTPGSNTLAPLGGESYTQLMSANVYLSGNLMPSGRLNPFVNVGVGYSYFDARTNSGQNLVPLGQSKNDISLFFGGGIDYFLSEFVSISGTGEYCLANTDLLDGRKVSGNDAYFRGAIEIRYYFFDQAFLTRMLEALKARYE